MDKRIFPGSVSQATMLPSLALTEFENFAQESDKQMFGALGLSTGDLRAYADTTTAVAQSVPDMTVKINPFTAFGGSPVLHGLGFNTNLSGQTGAVITGDGMTATCNVTVATASGSNPRIDLICFQIQSVDMNYADNNLNSINLKAVNPSTGAQTTPTEFLPNTIQRVAIQYVQGTASGSPAIPATPSGWTPLANIYVATSASSITTANIFFTLPYANRGLSLTKAIPFVDQLFAYTIARGLTLKVNAGVVVIGQTAYNIANTDVTMTDNSTNYVHVTSGGALANNTSGYPVDSIPVALVVAASGVITSVTDKRGWLRLSSTVGGATYPTGHLDGLELSYTSASQITISAGSCRSSDDTANITSASPIVVNLATSGLGGLDTSSEASSTVYDVYIIYNPTNGLVNGLFVANNAAPTLPAGYTKYRWLGSAVNDSGSNLYPGTYHGTGRTREFWYESYIQLVTNTTPTAGTYTDLSIFGFLPLQTHSREAKLWSWYRATGSGSSTPELRIRTKGLTTTNPPYLVTIVAGASTFGDATLVDYVNADSNGKVQIQRDSGSTNQSASVWLTGFRTHL